MPPTTNALLAMSMRFSVKIEGLDLGGWSKCDGLGLKVEITKYKEGGTNTYKPLLAGRVEYTDVKLTRAVDRNESRTLQSYLAKMTKDDGFKPGTGAVSVLDAHNQVVFTWSLRRCYPVNYSVSTLDAAGKSVLTEVLTLAHEGFLPG